MLTPVPFSVPALSGDAFARPSIVVGKSLLLRGSKRAQPSWSELEVIELTLNEATQGGALPLLRSTPPRSTTRITVRASHGLEFINVIDLARAGSFCWPMFLLEKLDSHEKRGITCFALN